MLLKILLLHARLSRLYPQVESLFSVLRRLSRCAGLVLERHNHRAYVLRQAGHLGLDGMDTGERGVDNNGLLHCVHADRGSRCRSERR